jgi:hypothetical protein
MPVRASQGWFLPGLLLVVATFGAAVRLRSWPLWLLGLGLAIGVLGTTWCAGPRVSGGAPAAAPPATEPGP